jgi:hypothetical protein
MLQPNNAFRLQGDMDGALGDAFECKNARQWDGR